MNARVRVAPLEARWRPRSWVVLSLALSACSRTVAGDPQTLALIKPRFPSGNAPYAERVYLNEALTFSFSEVLDRASVTSDSVRIVDDEGVEARGRLEVHGSSLRFVPLLPTSPDLSDAGLRPGRRYTLELAGFPRPDGLNSIHGHPLAATLVSSFTTVPTTLPNGEPKSWLLFDDEFPANRAVLKLFPPARGPSGGAYVVAHRGAIVLACDKPIDPTTLDEHDFVLQRLPGGPPLDVSVRLIENEPRKGARPRPANSRSRGLPAGAWEQFSRAALIEVVPRANPTREILVFSIKIDASKRCKLLDLGGQPVIWPMDPISVQFSDAGFESSPGTYVEDFLRTPTGSMRSQSAVPGFDGTASWTDSGRVEVRFPAAAGDGADGDVELAGDEPRAEIRAMRLDVRGGAECKLTSRSPVCILRSQGALSIAGTLSRAAPSDHAPPAEPDPDFITGSNVTLSSWLERVQSGTQPWTVLVAGGDLTIDGNVRVETPLLLCAGGMIRIPGEVHGTGTESSGQIWILGEGGGLRVFPRPNSLRDALVIDAPQGKNPLRRPLELCVMSQALPQRGNVARWLFSEARGSVEARGSELAHNGTWRVRYLPASAVAGSLSARERWYDDPNSLPLGANGSAESLVFLIELRVPVGGRWDPPFVDSLRLSWDERLPAGGLR